MKRTTVWWLWRRVAALRAGGTRWPRTARGESRGIDERGGVLRRGRGDQAHRQEAVGRRHREADQARRERLGLRQGRGVLQPRVRALVEERLRECRQGVRESRRVQGAAATAASSSCSSTWASSTSSPGKHDEGIKTLQEYIASACTPPPAEAHIFLANALVEKKRTRKPCRRSTWRCRRPRRPTRPGSR